MSELGGVYNLKDSKTNQVVVIAIEGQNVEYTPIKKNEEDKYILHMAPSTHSEKGLGNHIATLSRDEIIEAYARNEFRIYSKGEQFPEYLAKNRDKISIWLTKGGFPDKETSGP